MTTAERSDATRERILDAAEELFASGNAWRTPLTDVLRAAGQRNQSAIQYHFGSREELIFLLLERGRAAEIAQRNRLLEELKVGSEAPDLRDVVETLVRPACSALSSQRGRRIRMITADVARDLTEAQLADARPPDVASALDLLADAMPPMPIQLRRSRMGAALRLLIETTADRARVVEGGARPLLSAAAFARNLTEILLAVLTAPGATSERGTDATAR